MADKPCSTCEHFDPILRGTKDTRLAWCAKRSLYPYKDSPGQVTPPQAQRVGSPQDPAQPFLVRRDETRAECALYMPRKSKLNKAELMAKALGSKP